ncbi:insulin-like growth factor 2 mRNA-binding protein 2 [Platysternon megacephalum]|uniref:Insulin-like growth factor 2 mRNA-binding protein 2 n=1 Tax=Platysternon megacephalum TaxID=55544 RepID=A0A4D9EX05_9SAUR|nr:insulin-like growth factor 2 mRNA-binding protein 2 [Platysternon megacephalum]
MMNSRVTLSKFISEVVINNGACQTIELLYKEKKNFTRCQDVKTICYMFFFSKKSVHYESSTMYQVKSLSGMRVKAFLVHKEKFVNVKPVRFLHLTRSDMKNQGLCRITVTTKYYLF